MYKKIVPLIKGVDLLYHEATFAETDKKLAKLTGHSTTKQAASIAAEASVKQLLLGHFSSRYKEADYLLKEAKEIFKETSVANDLGVFKLPLIRENDD
jgi:ribonuclease Z